MHGHRRNSRHVPVSPGLRFKKQKRRATTRDPIIIVPIISRFFRQVASQSTLLIKKKYIYIYRARKNVPRLYYAAYDNYVHFIIDSFVGAIPLSTIRGRETPRRPVLSHATGLRKSRRERKTGWRNKTWIVITFFFFLVSRWKVNEQQSRGTASAVRSATRDFGLITAIAWLPQSDGTKCN